MKQPRRYISASGGGALSIPAGARLVGRAAVLASGNGDRESLSLCNTLRANHFSWLWAQTPGMKHALPFRRTARCASALRCNGVFDRAVKLYEHGTIAVGLGQFMQSESGSAHIRGSLRAYRGNSDAAGDQLPSVHVTARRRQLLSAAVAQNCLCLCSTRGSAQA